MFILKIFARILLFPLQCLTGFLLFYISVPWTFLSFPIGYFVFGNKRHFWETKTYKIGTEVFSHWVLPMKWQDGLQKKIWNPKFLK